MYVCRGYESTSAIPVYLSKDAHTAASSIQKVFRGYVARARASKAREEELVSIWIAFSL